MGEENACKSSHTEGYGGGGGEKGEKGRGDGEEGKGREGREGVLCNGTVCCGQSCSRKERDQSS